MDRQGFFRILKITSTSTTDTPPFTMQRYEILHTERGSVGTWGGLLVLITMLYLGQQLWLTHKARTLIRPSIQASIVHSAPVEPRPRLTDEQGHVEWPPMPQPVEIPASPYAAMLADVGHMLREGKLQEAQVTLRAVPTDALTDMAIRLHVATLWNDLGVHQAQAAGAMGAGASAYKMAVSINSRNSTAYVNMVLAYWE